MNEENVVKIRASSLIESVQKKIFIHRFTAQLLNISLYGFYHFYNNVCTQVGRYG